MAGPAKARFEDSITICLLLKRKLMIEVGNWRRRLLIFYFFCTMYLIVTLEVTIAKTAL